MVRTFLFSLIFTIVAAYLPNAIADEPQPLSITTDAPGQPPTLTQVNDGTYEITVQLKNEGSDAIVLWPYLSIKIMDTDGEEVQKATRIGRWGFRRSPSVLEEIPFVTLGAGQTHDVPVNLKRYTYDPDVIAGWQLPKKGDYDLVLSYKFDRVAVKKKYGKGCEDLDGADKPWNRAVEMDRTVKMKLEVR